MNREAITPQAGPPPGGPYSPIIRYGNLAFISGQVALDPSTGQGVRDSFEAETHQVLRNLRTQVEAAGSSMDKVLKTTVFLADMDNFARLNDIYVEYFAEPRPARSTICAAPPGGYRVEIEAVAGC